MVQNAMQNGPQFDWKIPEQEEDSTIDTVVQQVYSIITNTPQNQTTTFQPSETFAAMENFTITPVISEGSTSSIISTMFNSTNTSNEMNSTVIEEVLNSNTTMTDVIVTTTQKAFSTITEVTSSVIDAISNVTDSNSVTTEVEENVTTTENVFNTAVTTTNETIYSMFEQEHGDEHILYIVMGVILTVLVLLIIILLIIYRKYKMRNGKRCGTYFVTSKMSDQAVI